MLLILLVVNLLVHSLSGSRAGQDDVPVIVDGHANVPRGGTLDLRQVLSFKPDVLPATSRCRVTSLTKPNMGCATISPSIFDCRTYTGPILYQHLGCFAPVELATFMISTLPLNYTSRRSGSDSSSSTNVAQVYASTFAVELHVEEPHAILRLITVKTDEVDPVSQPGLLNLTIVFPSAMVGRSKYEVVSRWDEFRFPVMGDLSGTLNQPVPSGYVPASSLTYQPHSTTSETVRRRNGMDFVLVRVYAHWSPTSATFQSYYYLLGFNRTVDSSIRNTSSQILKLGNEVLEVKQAVYTPISSANFTLFNFTKNLVGRSSRSASRQGQQPLFYYTFPVLFCGSFQVLHTSTVNVSYTSFSDVDLQAGHVSFHPTENFSSTRPFNFPYNVTTVAGVLIATGNVSVWSSQRDYRYPSQRTNKPLQVAEGGWAAVTREVLDLYVLQPCDVATSLKVLLHPVHGKVVYSNGTQLRNERVLFSAVIRSPLLHYRHSGDEALTDMIYWEVWCLSGPAFSIVTPVHIATLDDSYPTLRLRSEVTAYQGWPVQLSSAMFQPRDVDSPLHNITFTSIHHLGLLLAMTGDVSRLCPDYYIPSATSSCVLNNTSEVATFSVTDLELLRVWYVPASGHGTDILELIVTDTLHESPEIYTLYVIVSSQHPNNSLVISTSEPYPQVLRNRTLPLQRPERIILTPYFLLSQAPPLSSSHIGYILETLPTNGYLCDITRTTPCFRSLETFTQLQISRHEIVYQTKNNTVWTSDNFTFVLSIEGFFSAENISHVFKLTDHLAHVVTSDTPLVLDVGSIAALTTTHLKKFASLLQSSNLTFHIVRLPRYGLLTLQLPAFVAGQRKSLDKGSSFTYADVLEGKLEYNSSLQRSEELCQDEVGLEAVAPSGMLHGRLPIVFKRHGDSLSVVVHPRTLIGGNYFKLSTEDILINSRFCSEWVVFYLITSPSVGRLTIKDNTQKTEYELQTGSRFTAHDLRLGAVVYRVPSSPIISQETHDIFHFQVVDPSSGFPPSLSNDSCDDLAVLCSNFTIRLLPPPRTQDYILDLSLTSQLPITWLPRYQAYGHTFSSADILHFNTSLPQEAVLLQLEKSPTWGNVVVNKMFVSFFTMADFMTGQVTYLKNGLLEEDWYREWLSLGLYAYLPSLVWQAQVLHVKMTWSVIEMDQIRMVVAENQGTVRLSIRRHGATWFQSRATVTTIPNTAVAQNNCSSLQDSSLQDSSHIPDYCHTKLPVTFDAGVVLKTISISLLDDEVAEGVESFYVALVEEEGLTNAILSGNMQTEVFISDSEDYNSVRILGDPGRDLDCDMEVSATEDQGRLVIPLVREGYISQELGVVCYTEDDSASAGQDYLPRPFSSLASRVTFLANSSTAECEVTILNDHLYELREQFLVRLAPVPSQGYVAEEEFASMCVFIRYDELDSPEVVFQSNPVIVQEKKRDQTKANFTLYRRGTDLNLTTTVKYNKVVRPGDTAVEGRDYILYTSPSPDCSLEGDYSPGGCVQFTPSQTTATLSLAILPDDILEGDEVFHLRIIYVREGRKSRLFFHSTLEFRILDATKPTYVGFLTSEIILYERSAFNSILLRRHGNLKGEAKVGVTVTEITATGSLPGNIDYSVAQHVKFLANRNESYCNLVVIPDNMFEGQESLNISLKTVSDSATEVVLDPDFSSIIVHILDPEDGPQVKFQVDARPNSTAPAWLSVAEPLSNQTLDQSLLSVTLVRHGDTNYVSTVSISARDGSAVNGRDFLLEEQEKTFPRGVDSLPLLIRILADHESNEDLNFWLDLVGTPDSTFDPLYFSYHDHVEVVILNTVVEGPYFLAHPQLDNKEDWGRSYSGGQYYDLPLLCLSSCDDMYDTLDQQVRVGCQQQRIDNSRTVYLWEMSVDGGATYHTLNASSAFTSTDFRELQTLYFDLGVHVRCRVQAVDQEGRSGYWRISESVLLNHTRYQCYGSGGMGEEHEGILTSYSSFGAFDQDMVRLEVLVRARPTSIPVVSIVPVPSSAASLGLGNAGSNISDAPCSTSDLMSGYSLLDYTVSVQDGSARLEFHPLYKHLDRATCRWRFVAWYSVSSLVEHCGGQRISSKETRQVAVQLASDHMTYIGSRGQIEMGGVWAITTVSLTSPLSADDVSVPGVSLLPPPIFTLSHLHHPLPHVFPIAISNVPNEEDLLNLILFSSAPPQQLLLLRNQSYPDSELLYVDVERGWQAWSILMDKQSQEVAMEMVAWNTSVCETCLPQFHQFTIPLEVDADRRGVSVHLLLDDTVQVLGANPEEIIHGERLNVHVQLSPLQQVQARGLVPHLQEAWLCQRVGMDDCSNRHSLISVMGEGQKSRYVVLVEFGYRSFNLSFSTSALAAEMFPSHWSLHISYNLSSSSAPHLQPPQSFSLLQSEVVLPFTMHDQDLEHLSATMPSSSSSLPEIVTGTTKLQAILIILSTAVLVLVVCLVTVSVASCASQGRAKLQAKIALTRNNLEDLSKGLKSRRSSSSSLHMKRRDRDSSKQLPHLKRSNSTLGLPTLERRPNTGSRSDSGSKSGHSSKKGELSESSMQRCHSLPALLPVSNLSYFYESPSFARRINLNKVHTRIKRLAKLDYSELYSNSKKKMLAEQRGKLTSKDWLESKERRNTRRQARPAHKGSSGASADILHCVGGGMKHEGMSNSARRKDIADVASYASFVVHSLAINARTPEPGSQPTSRV